MKRQLIKCKTQSFILVLEVTNTSHTTYSRIVYPITSKQISLGFDEEFTQEDKYDIIVEKMSANFDFYLKILFDFDHYKAKTKKYFIPNIIQISDDLAQAEQELLIESLATDYFYSFFNAVPSKSIKIELFVVMLRCKSIEQFMALFAPEMSLKAYDRRIDVLIHKSLEKEYFRSELLDFSNQLN